MAMMATHELCFQKLAKLGVRMIGLSGRDTAEGRGDGGLYRATCHDPYDIANREKIAALLWYGDPYLQA
jgi:hypothetical protein